MVYLASFPEQFKNSLFVVLDCVGLLDFVNISQTPTILLIGHFTVSYKAASAQTGGEKSVTSSSLQTVR